MIHMDKIKEQLYPELSFKVIGVLFDVFNHGGYGQNEKYYHQGIIAGFKLGDIEYAYKNKIGVVIDPSKENKFFPDFILEGKVALEIKRGTRLVKRDVEKVLEYLEANGLELGLVALFRPDGVKVTRVVNKKIVV